MDLKFFITMLSLAVAVTLNAAETTPPPKTVKGAYNDVKAETGTQLLTELVFKKGSKDLSADARAQLRDILYSAQRKGGIGEVTVISWADKEYPTGSKKTLDKDQRALADQRLYEIKNYIEENTIKTNTKTFNMAEQPDAVEKLLQESPNAKMKQSLESAGISQPGRTGMPPKASHALVLVSLK